MLGFRTERRGALTLRQPRRRADPRAAACRWGSSTIQTEEFRPRIAARYVSFDYGQVLDDHGVLQSVGSVGVAYDNALAESRDDSIKTELIAGPRVAHPSAARTGRRRVHRLV
jgi:hypothetical protein